MAVLTAAFLIGLGWALPAGSASIPWARVPWGPLLLGMAAAILGPRAGDGLPVAVWAGGFWIRHRLTTAARARQQSEAEGDRFLGRLQQRLEAGLPLPAALDQLLREAPGRAAAGQDVAEVLAALSARWPGPAWAAVQEGWRLVARHGGSMAAVVEAARAGTRRRLYRRRRREEEEQSRRTTLVVLAAAPAAVLASFRAVFPAFFHLWVATSAGIGILTGMSAVASAILVAATRLALGDG